ncbi:hypothetical protein C1H46_030464 [Malus baccata]|uniref:Armadillo repeat-containing domain-containing protein n=1 Tax=Malus baccata TaxID=106549 RepID=A0A540LC06_MALBA|nr:hypothetical protein C1H46_030464 [Malus baccata]
MVEHNNSGESKLSIYLQIEEPLHHRLNETSSAMTNTMFEPQNSIEKTDSSTAASVGPLTAQPVPAPEKKLTIFALRLAMLEKTATGLGTLKGTRIFSRSQVLEWHHQTTWSITDASINSFRELRISSSVVIHSIRAFFRPVQKLVVRKQSQRSRDITRTNGNSELSQNSDRQRKIVWTWTSSEVPLLPYVQRIFHAKHINTDAETITTVGEEACKHDRKHRKEPKVKSFGDSFHNQQYQRIGGEKHPMLQQLGIEILMSLALEADATERGGGIGEDKSWRSTAMLVLESKNNCLRILKLGVLENLVEALEVQLLRMNAARILRNLCTYNSSNYFHQLKGIMNATPKFFSALETHFLCIWLRLQVLRVITSEEHKLQEAMVGLATPVLAFLSPEESRLMFKKAGITEGEVANELVQILKKHRHPPIKVSRIRRFSIELAICMMRDRPENVRVFKDLGMEKELEFVLETTAELEIFNIFSGTVGMSRHSTMIHSLVKTALGLLAEGWNEAA